MKIVNLIQGTPEWYAHRAQHFNASDAPAMLGTSTNRKRSELLREVAGGVPREFSDYVQDKIISPGHVYEALARALAEKIIGEDLYPCVGVDGLYSASFDGLTLLEDTAWEHKRLNEDLRNAMFEDCTGADLPEMYRVQMEHQCLVSTATERVLFMASEWDANGNLVEERHCWYTPDLTLRERIVAGWTQFAADVADYVPEPTTAPAPIGRTPDQLPALRIEVTGMVTASNLAEWKGAAIAVFQGIRTDLQTDQDFADAERTVKWCGDIEDQLKAAKQHALSQTASIDELFRTIDAISAEARTKRLELDKLVKARKEAIRGELVERGRQAVLAHYQGINATLSAHALTVPPTVIAELANAIKGKKTVASLSDAVDTAVAGIKIAASQQADRVRANIAVLAEHAAHDHLFADRVALCATKAPDDLRNLAAARIAEHQQREAARLEAERERIRQEEAAKLERERAAAELQQAKQSEGAELSQAAQALNEKEGAKRFAEHHPKVAAAPIVSGQRIKLGDINAAIAPLSISADGLAQLGFQPVGTERAAKLYDAGQFEAITTAMQRVLAKAWINQREAA